MPDEKNKSQTNTLNTLPRFFAAPNLDALADHPVIGPRVNPNWKAMKPKKKKETKKMRYAAYLRVSSEEQIGNYSIDAQKRAIEAWVVTNGGILARVYVDEGKSGRTADRPAFKEMQGNESSTP